MAEIAFVAEDIERRPTDALVPYARNARTHTAEQVGQIAASMREFGWTYPVLVDEDDGIIAGHGRILAAQKLKLVEVPVIVARGWSPEKKRAYVLADNKLALNAGWDEQLLKIELGELQTAGFDLSLTGFASAELTAIFSTQDGNTDPDDAPEPLPTPVSLAGDVWLFEGGHRLICGDCTDKGVVEKLLDGRKPQLLVADPPYGVDYDPAFRSQALKDGARRAEGQVRNDDRADWREAWALFPGDVAYVWHADKFSSVVEASLHACGFETRNQIIWRKTRFVIGRGHYHVGHEPCWYMVRKTKNGHWSGSRKESTVWDIEHVKSETGHGTQKPVEAMARPMRNNSAPGDLVYDPFMGSGTTLIAAHANKRVALGCEISGIYCDVSVRRFEAFTGTKVRLAETGETYAEVAARRAGSPQEMRSDDIVV